MFLNVNKVIEFVRYSDDGGKTLWYYNANDGKVCTYNEICDIYNIKLLNNTEIPDMGYIAFPQISFLNTQKKYIESLNDRRLLNRLSKLTGNDYSFLFWKYVDDGSYNLIRWHNFLKKEKKDVLKNWCDMNNIKYTLKH